MKKIKLFLENTNPSYTYMMISKHVFIIFNNIIVFFRTFVFHCCLLHIGSDSCHSLLCILCKGVYYLRCFC